MTVGRYLVGLLMAVIALAPLVIGAGALRTRLLPRWSGPPAIVAQAVIALAMFVCVAELLGLVGLFRTVPMVAGLAVFGGIGWLVGRRSERAIVPPSDAPAERDDAPANRLGPSATWVALAGVAVVVAEWGAWTVSALHQGIESIDSRWYHLPAAARFVQDGSITSVHYFDGGPLTAFYPVTSELFHGFGMMLLGNDTASTVLNLGWLALALLAGWCIGRPFGVAPVTLLGVVVFLATPGIVSTQPGTALTDIVGLALLLCVVAIFVNSDRTTGAAFQELFVAGLAGGLAIGTKYTFLPVIGALTIGVVVIARRGSRVRNGAAWLAGLGLTGSLWYLRNLLVVRNPVPPLELELGPLRPPSPPTNIATDSVFEYVLDAGVWDRVFLPGLGHAFGPAWWVLLALAGAGLALALISGPTRLQRMLGLVGILAGVVYIFQPQSLGLGFGDPVFFEFNLRYGAPALILGLVLLPLVPSIRRGRRAWWVLGALGIVLAATQLDPTVWPTELRDGRIAEPVRRIDALGGVAMAAVILGCGALLLAWTRRATLSRRSTALMPITAVTVVALVTAGFAVQTFYLDRRYALETRYPEPSPIPEAYRWARDLRDSRIAVVGNTLQYPLYGTDLSNHVQYIGRRGPNGAFSEFEGCVGWRRALNRGSYDFVVVASPPAFAVEEPPARAWTEADPATSLVLRENLSAVFRVDGELDPDGCREFEPRGELAADAPGG